MDEIQRKAMAYHEKPKKPDSGLPDLASDLGQTLHYNSHSVVIVLLLQWGCNSPYKLQLIAMSGP